ASVRNSRCSGSMSSASSGDMRKKGASNASMPEREAAHLLVVVPGRPSGSEWAAVSQRSGGTSPVRCRPAARSAQKPSSVGVSGNRPAIPITATACSSYCSAEDGGGSGAGTGAAAAAVTEVVGEPAGGGDTAGGGARGAEDRGRPSRTEAPRRTSGGTEDGGAVAAGGGPDGAGPGASAPFTTGP